MPTYYAIYALSDGEQILGAPHHYKSLCLMMAKRIAARDHSRVKFIGILKVTLKT